MLNLPKPKLLSEDPPLQSLQKTTLCENAKGIFIVDPSKTILWVNQTFCDLSGHSVEELVGRTSTLLSGGEHTFAFLTGIWRQVNKNREWKGCLKHPCKDGTVIDLKTVISPVFTQSGEASQFVVLCENNSENIRAANSNLLISAAIEHADDAIVLADLEGHVTYVNRSFFRLFGLHAAEIISKPLTQLFSKDTTYIPSRETELRTMLQHGWVEVIELSNQGSKPLLVRIRISQIRNKEEDMVGFACYFYNLGEETRQEEEKKLMEVRLRQAEKLEAIGQLAAGIAHEINTPTQFVGDNIHFMSESIDALLKIVKRLDETIKEGSPGLAPEQVTELKGLIEDAEVDYLEEELPTASKQASDGIRRITEIVNAMKEFCHPGTRTLKLTNLNDALKKAATVATNEWKYHAKLELDLDEQLKPIFCLPAEINQVFLNLIVNAAHAIKDAVKSGQRKTGILSLESQAYDDFAEIRIRDNALGIPDEIKDRIFEPFFTTKEVGNGTGQGLAIAYDVIIQKHQGQLFFESDPDAGTTFYIRLPVSATAPQS